MDELAALEHELELELEHELEIEFKLELELAELARKYIFQQNSLYFQTHKSNAPSLIDMDNTLERQFYGMDLMNGGMYYIFDFILKVSCLQTIRNSIISSILFFHCLPFMMTLDLNPLFYSFKVIQN